MAFARVGRPPISVAGVVLVAILAAAASRSATGAGTAAPRELSRFDREQGRMMLGIVRKDVERYYYDPAFRGLPLDKAFARAEERIAEARILPEIYAAIAEALLTLDDSHTYFVPPGWSGKVEFGWFTQMIGDRCHLMAVQPGSEAESLGLRKGDRVLTIDGETPTRESMSIMMYDQRVLAPRARSRLVVQSPGGDEREVVVRPRVTPGKIVSTRWDRSTIYRELEDQAYLDRHRLATLGDQVAVWKMPQFNLTREEVGRIVKALRKYPRLIIDMRGNPGGAVESLEYLTGAFLGAKVTIGTVRSRGPMKPVVSRKSPQRYEGELVVLVDSASSSAAELFSRGVQIADRGKVLGDRTAGRVMISQYYDRQIGMGSALDFGASITVADIIMTDGKSLEKNGVTPDEILLPSAEDLASDRDPVLSRAAALCGVALDPARAGAMFPFEWKR